MSVVDLLMEQASCLGEEERNWMDESTSRYFCVIKAYMHIKNTHKDRHNYESDIVPTLLPLLCVGGWRERCAERWRGEGQGMMKQAPRYSYI